jgi:hypothetical protein
VNKKRVHQSTSRKNGNRFSDQDVLPIKEETFLCGAKRAG